MSRIHEALKKAAKERNSKHSQSVTPELVDFSEGGLANSVIAQDMVPRDSPIHTPEVSTAAYAPVQDFLGRCSRPVWNIEPRLSVFSEESHSLQGAERFRTLRSRLVQISADQPLHRILVTSSVPEEGKTFVTANLAQSFVRQSDCRVLLVDADIRKPRLHLHFGAPVGPGLSEFLQGKADETQVLQVGADGNLCLIPGGHQVTNASELIHCERMKDLLERMSRLFDYVILDSPPALAVHDASVLADYCDGVLFVVRAGHTDYEIAERASSEFHNKNLLGVVLNRVDESDTYEGYYDEYYAKPRGNGISQQN